MVSSLLSQIGDDVLVFPDIIIGASLLVDIVAFEATIWRILLVLAPTHSFSFK